MATELSFGQWVKQRRKALDLTQHELAQRIGCAISTIQKIEIEARQPSLQIAELLAEHLELSASERENFLYLSRHHGEDITLALPASPAARSFENTLPTPLTSLIGREWEVATVCASLLRPEVRLLTISGPPGIGKTRLALAVAQTFSDPRSEIQIQNFADGVVFVALAPISDANFVLTTIVRTLGLKDAGSQSPLAQLKNYLRHRTMLLVLDNFEHVLAAAPAISELLESAAQLKVLVTSRALLQLYGEHEFVAPTLALPDLKQLSRVDNLISYAAVELFVQRAQAARLEFELNEQNAATVAELCVHLDGLPLAIELAAVRSKHLSPKALLTRLTNVHAGNVLDFGVLTSHAYNLPTRQQTLHNAIAWSYDLLNPTEQRVFRSLSVFAGGCSSDALAAVVSPSLMIEPSAFTSAAETEPLTSDHWYLRAVQSLVNQSLVVQQVDNDGLPRFILLEMLREYALEKLEELGEAAMTFHAHALYFLQLAENFKKAASEEKGDPLLKRMELEIDNFRTALSWTDVHDQALVLRLALALAEYWSQRRYLSEGRQWLEKLHGWLKDSLSPLSSEQKTEYAAISGMLAFFTWLQGDSRLAQHRWAETIPLWRELKNWCELGLTLHFLARAFYDRGDYLEALDAAQESVALLRKFDEPAALGWALGILGSIIAMGEEYEKAYKLFKEALTIYQRLGHRWSMSKILLDMSDLFFALGEFERTRSCLEEALPVFQKTDHPWMVARTLYLLGKVHWQQGDKTRATKLWDASVMLANEVGAQSLLAGTYFMQGLAAHENQDRQQAEANFCHSFHLYQLIENRIGMAYAVSGLAGLADSPLTKVQLLAAASTVLDTTRLPFDLIERHYYEQLVIAARVQFDNETFAAVWKGSRAMPLEEAILCIQPSDQIPLSL